MPKIIEELELENNEKVKPEGYEKTLSDFDVVARDSSSNEPIAWGFTIISKMDEERFTSLRSSHDVVCFGGTPPRWVVVSKWLTAEEAVERYGAVTKIVNGPRGAWKSTTYGATTFTSRHMAPAAMQQRALRQRGR